MAKFNLSITAHVVNENTDDAMLIYSRDMSTHPYTGSLRPIWSKCKELVSCVMWQLDDGEDNAHTDYCQYVAYTDGNSYLLAAWNKMDEKKGYIKY